MLYMDVYNHVALRACLCIVNYSFWLKSWLTLTTLNAVKYFVDNKRIFVLEMKRFQELLFFALALCCLNHANKY